MSASAGENDRLEDRVSDSSADPAQSPKILNLLSEGALPRKSFAFTVSNGVTKPITQSRTVQDWTDQLLGHTETKSFEGVDPEFIAAMDRFWAQERAAVMHARSISEHNLGDRYQFMYGDYLPGRELMYRRVTASIEKRLGSDMVGKSIAEIGGGSGLSLTMLARLGAETHNLDVSQGALDFFRYLSKLSGVQHKAYGKAADFYHTGYQDNSFDLTFNVGVMEHLDQVQQDQLMEEMVRITKPGGYVMVAVPNFDSPFYELVKAHEQAIFQEDASMRFPMEDFSEVNPLQLLESHGLKTSKQGMEYAGMAPPMQFERNEEVVVKGRNRNIIMPEDFRFFTGNLPYFQEDANPRDTIHVWNMLEQIAPKPIQSRYSFFKYAFGKKEA